MTKKVYFIGCFILGLLLLASWSAKPNDPTKTKKQLWVDSIYNSFTLEEKFGQLFMVAAYSNRGEKHEEEVFKLIEESHIGGLIFFQGGPKRQIRQTNMYQAKSKVPLLIAMDAEWGLNMRLDSTLKFPSQMVLGAIQDDSLIYWMGKSMAMECKSMGVHVNFAPVVDINVNPRNPVIGFRSFGENKENVAQKAILLMKGMQDNGIMAVAKHFPGHGDTDTDSHYALPIVNHSVERIDSIELYPFKKVFEQGIGGVMVAHLQIPALDNRKNKATTLSENVVTKLLQNKLGYNGLIFTDALNMKGVSAYNKPGVVDEMAFMAGNDVLLFPQDVPAAIKRMQKNYKAGNITEERLARSVKKILSAKYDAGLSEFKPISDSTIHSDLMNLERKLLIQKLHEASITVVRNDEQMLPITKNKFQKIACVGIGLGYDDFYENTKKFDDITIFDIKNITDDALKIEELKLNLSNFDAVIIGIGSTNNSNGKDYGISAAVRNLVNDIDSKTKCLVVDFGNPYSLKFFSSTKNLICAHTENPHTLKVTPQIIFGAVGANGKLPVTSNPIYTAGKGLDLIATQKLGFAVPEEVGMNSDSLRKIDQIAERLISAKAAPGCQILVAKDGKVVYNKSFGYLTYEKEQPVTDQTVYDIASISKVAGTLQAVMKLQSEEKLNIDARASEYLPELKGTNKEYITIKNLLLHQAGLKPFLPYWTYTLDKEKNLDERYYCTEKDGWFCKEIAYGLFSTPDIEDSVWRWTIKSELRKPINQYRKKRKVKKNLTPLIDQKFDYSYSDLSFFMLKKIVERISGQPLDRYLDNEFYVPLGLDYMTFNPSAKMPLDNIAPTEMDNKFRRKQLKGFVHDEMAALLGGIAGHAGLFSNAMDLATLMQMNLQNGFYENKTYFANDTVVRYFAKKQVYENRRGLGWDKPYEYGSTKGPTSSLVSSQTYGHTGFTGTCVWADPKYNLIYVFLSNRIYPDANNNLLINNNYRPRIQDVIYRSMQK